MKRVVLTALCHIICICIGTAQEIELEKHFGGYEFSQYGESLKMKEVIKIVEPNSASVELIKKARVNRTWSSIFGNSGTALVGFAIGRALDGGDDAWTIAGIGAGLIGVSIPLSISSQKKAQQGVDLYNNSLSSTTYDFQKPQFTIEATSNGIGLVMRF